MQILVLDIETVRDESVWQPPDPEPPSDINGCARSYGRSGSLELSTRASGSAGREYIEASGSGRGSVSMQEELLHFEAQVVPPPKDLLAGAASAPHTLPTRHGLLRPLRHQ